MKRRRTKQLRQCARCVLDTGDRATISFDAKGVCSFCKAYDASVRALPKTAELRLLRLNEDLARIRQAGAGRQYDCILGVSGGIDSTYLAYLARREGLRPLVVHFDNGWNSELAVENINRLVTALEFDLHTYVINWEEFKDLQLAYLEASVIDIEVVTDHAIYGALYSLAIEHGIKFILSGNNLATEGVLPYEWTFKKLDHVNIMDIHRQFGRQKIATYPFVDHRMKRRIRRSGIEVVTPLDYVPYVMTDVSATLERELGWRNYGAKHHESLFTRFYQEYILPVKFGVDKRKAHFSSLICSGQMDKADALAELSRKPWEAARAGSDKEYVLKKLGLEPAEFDRIMRQPVRSHWDFEFEGSIFHAFPVLLPLRPVWRALKRTALRLVSETTA